MKSTEARRTVSDQYRNTKSPELRFRAVLDEGGVRQIDLVSA